MPRFTFRDYESYMRRLQAAAGLDGGDLPIRSQEEFERFWLQISVCPQLLARWESRLGGAADHSPDQQRVA